MIFPLVIAGAIPLVLQRVFLSDLALFLAAVPLGFRWFRKGPSPPPPLRPGFFSKSPPGLVPPCAECCSGVPGFLLLAYSVFRAHVMTIVAREALWFRAFSLLSFAVLVGVVTFFRFGFALHFLSSGKLLLCGHSVACCNAFTLPSGVHSVGLLPPLDLYGLAF